MKYWITITGVVFGLATVFFCSFVFGEEPYRGYPYVPAMYGGVDQRLVLLSLTGKNETTVSLPVPLGGYELSPDGKAIYATSGGRQVLTRPMPGLFKIDLHSMRVSAVPGSGDFRFYSSIAISLRQQDAVVAGKYWNGAKLVCGVFDLSLLNGSVRPVLETTDCDDAITRTDISLSPDLKYAVAIHKRSLELIDMANGSSRKLGDGFMKTAWAPDGKWIAAAKYSLLRARMVLFDGSTFTARKTLESSTVFKVSWSPDSRFLLARRLRVGCGPDEYTYEAFEVETAKASVIESSRCKVLWNDNDVGWVDRTITVR